MSIEELIELYRHGDDHDIAIADTLAAELALADDLAAEVEHLRRIIGPSHATRDSGVLARWRAARQR